MTSTNAKRRKPRGSLSKEVILRATQKLLREQGLEALSIRKIAVELDAGTMSIYNHFPTRQAIIYTLVSDFISRAHQQAHPKDDWKTWCHGTFMDIYRASIAEPEYLTLMLQSHNIGKASTGVYRESMLCLTDSGLSQKRANTIFFGLLSLTLGAALLRVNLALDNRPEKLGATGESSAASRYDKRQYDIAETNQIQSFFSVEGFHQSLREYISAACP